MALEGSVPLCFRSYPFYFMSAFPAMSNLIWNYVGSRQWVAGVVLARSLYKGRVSQNFTNAAFKRHLVSNSAVFE